MLRGVGASLGFSITALLPVDADEHEQEAVLLDLLRRRPHAVFHDVVRSPRGAAVVRVAGEQVLRLGDGDDRPAHAGTLIGRYRREHLDLLVDHGDVLVPGWGEHANVTIAGHERVIADLDEVAAIVEETVAELELEEDPDAEYGEFLRELMDEIALARRDQLPVVAYWS